MDIDDMTSDNHRPEDQDPDPAGLADDNDSGPGKVWDGLPDGPVSDTSPF